LTAKLQLVPLRVSGLDESGDEVAISALLALSESDQELLRLVAWGDLSPREAAAALGVSVASFRVRAAASGSGRRHRCRDRRGRSSLAVDAWRLGA
jgi:DNA-directed RNA polymerase specialized sigma24 family protein